LDVATRLFETQRFTEAVVEARKVLARNPGNLEAERLVRRALDSLERIERGNRRAKSFLESDKYDEAIASLGEVLKISPSNTEARQLLAKLEHHARKGAEEARAEMVKARSGAESVKAQQFAPSTLEVARNLELEGVRLYEAKQYGQAIPKLFEAGRNYSRAEKDALAERDRLLTAQKEREQAAEQNRQVASQQEALRKQGQDARLSYNRALERATRVGASASAPELFRGAIAVATQAQAKWDRGDYLGAKHDFEAASDSMERAGTTAEEAIRQKGIESDRRETELTQRGTDRQAVLDVLSRYAEAYENRDLVAFKTLRPTLAEKEERKLKDFFRIARSIKVELQPIADPQFAGNTATVTCRFVVQFADEHGLKKPTETNTTLSLRKKGPSWIIEEMRQTTAP
jgi:tetratricopeptide (TPR) repeat protein